MDQNNLIVWQKWIDPFGQDEEPTDFDPYVGDYEDELEKDDNTSETDQKEYIEQTNKKAIKVIATPMGIIPLNENTLSGKLFNFWMGHTNFDITPRIVDVIEKTKGVETLDVFTRYRFRIAVGKAFDDSEIMRNINKQIYNELNDG